MKVTRAICVRKVNTAALTLGFVTSACGALTGLDHDFHEVDCFKDVGCGDGALNNATLIEAATEEGARIGTPVGDASDASVDAPGVEAGDTSLDRLGTPSGDRKQAADQGNADAGNDTSVDAGVCGNGFLDPGEQCDQGSANVPVASAYGRKGACTTLCTWAPYCGDGILNAAELCDDGGSGSTALGACNPECTGFYTKKVISQTSGLYSTNLGGPSGADTICQSQFGMGWKALVVGGGRRATVTPYVGDSQLDWVIHKYTYYYNAQDQFIWRTDSVPLLGVSGGMRQSLSAAAFDAGGGVYPWSGWNTDWTTTPDDAGNFGTCLGWTDAAYPSEADFASTDLRLVGSEYCGSGSFILCVQQ